MKPEMMTQFDAELLLLANGYCPRDAYDMLADAGFDPHPDCAVTRLSFGCLFLLCRQFEEIE